MSDQLKLVLLRVGQQSGGSFDVKAYATTTAIPNDAWNDSNKISFRGPIPIRASENNTPCSHLAGSPIYDFQKSQLIWAAYARPGSEFPSRNNGSDCWYFGKHLQLENVERLPVGSSEYYNNHHSFVLDNGKLSTCFSKSGPWLIRRGEKGWEHMDIVSQWSFDSGRQEYWAQEHARLYKSQTYESEFVYALCKKRYTEQTVNINAIRASTYAEMKHDDQTIRWHRVEVEMGFQIHTSVTPITLYDTTSGKTRLYMFQIQPSRGCIEYAYVQLRKDGSIDTYESKISALGYHRLGAPISTTAKDLHAFSSGNKLSLLWHTPDLEGQVFWMVGDIGSDGSAPAGHLWQTVQHDLKKLPDYKDGQVSYHAAVVAETFVE